MIEMIVAIVIIGVLLAILTPTYLSIVPRRAIKTDANAVTNLLKRARSAAANYQRPVRILVDCTPETRGSDGSEPCRSFAQMAVFNSSGAIKSWSPFATSSFTLNEGTEIEYQSNTAKIRPQYNYYKSYFNGFFSKNGVGPRTYGVSGLDGFNRDSFVVIFTPGGEAITYCPIEIIFKNRGLGNSNRWVLSVVNSTGHIRLKNI
jgi:Tfp pilus assembly protein FimT